MATTTKCLRGKTFTWRRMIARKKEKIYKIKGKKKTKPKTKKAGRSGLRERCHGPETKKPNPTCDGLTWQPDGKWATWSWSWSWGRRLALKKPPPQPCVNKPLTQWGLQLIATTTQRQKKIQKRCSVWTISDRELATFTFHSRMEGILGLSHSAHPHLDAYLEFYFPQISSDPKLPPRRHLGSKSEKQAVGIWSCQAHDGPEISVAVESADRWGLSVV